MRLFVGVELDDRVRAAAAEAIGELRARLKRSHVDVTARFVEPENLHVTVWFIGEATDDRAAQIQQTLRAAFSTRTFDLAVRGCGAFPPSGSPRVFWLGITTGADSMVRLYDEVKDRLTGIGFEPEKRPYSPHITIARVKEVKGPGRAVREVLEAVPADCGACRVEAVTLFRSHLSPKGSRYEPLLRVPLS